MFTSKKALYLTNNFERISPITNIDSLYYEQVLKTGTEYKVERLSVVKHMPILCDLLSYGYKKEQTYSYEYNVGDVSILNVHINTCKNMLHNPYDVVTNKFLYDTSLYEIYSPGTLDLSKILIHYKPTDIFAAEVSTHINELEILNASINNTSIALNDLSTAIHSDVSGNQHIYSKRYKMPLINSNEQTSQHLLNAYMYVNVLDVSIQNSTLTTISLNSFANKGALTDPSALGYFAMSYLKNWVFEYVPDSSIGKITYLIDDFNNEGTYNFRDELYNGHTTYYADHYVGTLRDYYFDVLRKLETSPNQECNITHNKIDGNVGDVILKFLKNFNFYNTQKILVTNNKFIKSSRIYVSLNYNNLICSNNTIMNSTNINLTCSDNYTTLCNNTILNSKNYVLNIIDGNNNTIINCENSSIKIIGNNNYIVNVKNASLVVGNNTVIINNSSYNAINNNIAVQNCNLFLDDSLKILNSTYSNVTAFGSNSNHIDVYYDGIHSLK